MSTHMGDTKEPACKCLFLIDASDAPKSERNFAVALGSQSVGSGFQKHVTKGKSTGPSKLSEKVILSPLAVHVRKRKPVRVGQVSKGRHV